MRDPFILEQRYQALKLISSPRLQLLRMMEFIRPLLETDSRTYLSAYLPELIPQVSALALKTDFTGTNASFLDNLRQCLEILADVHRELDPEGHAERAVAYLSAEREGIEQMMARRLLEPRPASADTRSVSLVEAGWIPMVEREQLLTASAPEFAALRRLHVDITFSTKSGSDDELEIGQMDARDGAGLKAERVALEAARKTLKLLTHVEDKRKLRIRSRFSGVTEQTAVVGESLGAGLAAVLCTELLRLYQHREEYALRGDVAITGSVDAQGNMLAVDEEGLKLKIEACTFSWIRYLVVPKEQEQFCRTYAAEITNSIPDSQSTISNPYSPISPIPHPTSVISHRVGIVGASSVSDLFYDRRLTDSWRVPVVKQVARRVWKRRRMVGIAIVVLLLGIIGKMAYGPFDRNPVKASLEGEVCVIENMFGEVLEKFVVGRVSGEFPRQVAFADVTGDDRNEIIWAQNSSYGNSLLGEVYCRELGSEAVLWKKELSRKLVFPDNPVQNEDYSANKLLAGDFDLDGRMEVYVATVHTEYPSFLLKLDARNGDELGFYLNAGAIQEVVPWDLDGDGLKELLVGGISNAWHAGFFAVLDPRLIRGHSPLPEHYRVDSIEAACERYYMIFPKTIVSEAFPDQVPWGRVEEILISQSNKRIRLAVSEPTMNGDYKAIVHPSLAFDLRPVGVQTGDDFDMLAHSLFARGLLKHKPDNAYFNAYMRQIAYWNGEKWQHEPVVNRRWVERAKKESGGKETEDGKP